MMKKQLLLTALLALLNGATLCAQILFEQRYGINNDDHEFAGGGALSADGGLLLCGSTEQDKTHHLFVQKLDSAGVEVWYKLYTQLGSGNLFGIIAAAGGGYIVSGYALNPANDSYDALLFHIDENGNLLWVKTYGTDAADIGLAACQLNNGNLVLLGGTTQADNTPAHFRAIFDPAGNLLSSKIFTTASDVTTISAIATADGGYAAAVSSGNFSSAVRIIKYEAGLNEQWSGPLTAYNILTNSTISTLYDLKPTADGFLLCVQAGNGVHLLHIGPAAGPLWTKRVHTGFPYGAGIQTYPDGTIFMAAHAFPFIFKTMAADGATLDSVGTPFLTLASSNSAQYVFQADRGVYLFGITPPGLFRGYTADRVTVTGAPAAAWSKTFGQDMPDEEETGDAITATAGGGFVLAGTRQDSSGNNDVWVFRADPQGSVVWEKMFDIQKDAFDDARIGSVKTDAAGNIIVLAASSFTDADYHLLKLSPNGDLIFDKIIDSAAYYAEFYRAYALPDGGFIACITIDDDTQLIPRLIRIGANGNVIWKKSYAGNQLNDVIPMSDGSFMCAGTKTAKPWIFKTDGAGNLLWEKIYTEVAYGGLFSMTLTTDGYLAATGGAWDASGIAARALALKADAGDGSLIWQKQFSKGDKGYWLGTAALPAPSGGMCFMGTLLQPPANADLFSAIFRSRVSISLVDADGNLVSEQTFGNDATRPIGQSAAGTSDGYVIFCATVEAGSSLQDAWVVKTAFNTVSATKTIPTVDFSTDPNPASGNTRLSLHTPYTGPVQIRVFDAAGREVTRIRDEKDTENWNMNLPLRGLQTGTYRIQVVTNEGQGVRTIVVVSN